MHLEPFEERTLFAIGPSFVGTIEPDGTVLSPGQILHTAPTELTLRFDAALDGNTLTVNGVPSIRFTRGGDHILNNGNDVTVTPGYLALGDKPTDVIVRFASALPDDKYQLLISGALKSIANQAFNGGTSVTQTFTLDLGAQVVSIVPQPVIRDPNNVLSQADSGHQIDVYFNVNDPLVSDPANGSQFSASANNPAFYELIRTNGTTTEQDDQVFNPTSVNYDPTTGKAVLRFDPVGATPSPLDTPDLYRLRIGNSDPLALPPKAVALSSLPGSSFDTAATINTAATPYFTAAQGTQSIDLSGFIGGSRVSVTYPGGNNEPGQRDIPGLVLPQNHFQPWLDPSGFVHETTAGNGLPEFIGPPDLSGTIPVYKYNFQSNYGTVLGQPVFNTITETQKQRVREALSYYARHLGVEFEEVAVSPNSTFADNSFRNVGFTFATGDVRSIQFQIDTKIGSVTNGSEAVINGSIDWGKSESGGAYFQQAMADIGHLLGLGFDFDAPPLTDLGLGQPQSITAENVFPGDADILYGQFLHPPVGNDINIFNLTVPRAGQVNFETFAERIQQVTGNSAPGQLDTVITIYDGNHNLLARNDNYYGKDSFVHLQLDAGNYFVAVTSTGNTHFDPTIANSGFGGTTQGAYQLRVTFAPTPADGIKDLTGTLLDADGDGAPGGVDNFWFRVADTAHTLYVDKANAQQFPNGSLANPYTVISTALAAAAQLGPGTVVRIEGNSGADHILHTLTDNSSYNIGFDSLGNPLSDGSKFEIPAGVTVMVDAGAIIKLRAANIDAGSSAQGVPRQGGGLQVLGTPATEKDAQGRDVDIGTVYFTSYYDNTIGTDPGV
ncbi:MAG: DVUA0089 family protein, partial [Planctomycetia bacterium]|nr:DVUA0089 family protein [Planctomycetia bacterium]